MGNTNTGVPHHKALPGHAHQTARPVFHWKERDLWEYVSVDGLPLNFQCAPNAKPDG